MIDDELLGEVFAGRRGLPGEAFVDEAWFQREQQDLLRTHWLCIGFAADAAGPGDVCPIAFAGLALLLARDLDGTLRVFHNVCSHRGAELVQEPACAKRALTCPYHRWSYALDGTLEHTAHAGGFRIHVTPEAEMSELGLREVRSAVWHQYVFVDLSGTAEPFNEFIGATATRMAPVDFGELRHDPSFDVEVEVASNWKTIVENFVESYHVPQVHPELQKFNPMSAHFQILGGARYAGQGGTAYGAADNPVPMPGDGLPVMESLTKQTFSYESFWIYPNLIIAPIPNMTFAIIVDPHSAGVTAERVRFWFHGDDSMNPEHAAARAETAAAVVAINNEDIGIVESCQRGRHSPAFVGGVFMTNQEATSMLVQRIIAGRLLQQRGQRVDFASLPTIDIFHDLAPSRVKA